MSLFYKLIVTIVKLISTIVTDINECLTNNGGCSHNCTNTAGSYNCGCADGYILQPNKHDCLKSEANKCIYARYDICLRPYCLHVTIDFYGWLANVASKINDS